MMKMWWRRVRPRLLAPVVYNFARLIGLTLRLRTEGYERAAGLQSGKIYAGWHGRSFLATHLWRGRGVWVMISHSRDGEMQDGIFKRFGYRTIRGSTGRGGARAAIEAIRVLRAGNEMALTPDGPRGPSCVVQGGTLLMAQKSGVPIVPVGVSARRRWLMRSWDRYLVPKPFTEAIMIFGEPIYIPRDATEVDVETVRLELQAAMNNLEQLAEAKMGHP